MRRRLGVAMLALAIAAAGAVTVPLATAAAQADDPAAVGRFLAPFEDQRPEEGSGACITDADGRKLCKPAGAAVIALSNGKILYWDALEGTENLDITLVIEAGKKFRNARTRTIDLSGGTPVFSTPSPEDAGANPNGDPSVDPLPLLPNTANDGINDGDLFCSDQVQLADGRVLAVGGTNWYNDPAIPGTDLGIVELAGLTNARVFDPATEQWTQSGSMQFARWYPSLVTLPDGKVLVTSGVSKLLKPIYPDRPFESGANVKQLELYDPATGAWSTLPESANRSLPLFPRIHLLPNGHIYYDTAGQSFNPFGQAYDEALWNISATFDPATNRWTDLGVPGLGLGALPGLPDLPLLQNGDLNSIPLLSNIPLDGLPNPGGNLDLPGFGFRGSTFSIMLPLVPDPNGDYTRASFLSAGGTASAVAPSPGTLLGTDRSRVNTVTIDPATGRESLVSQTTVPLDIARWYPSGVLLPTGEVMAFSGADTDEVVGPGFGRPVRQAELFDPETNTWTPMATATRPRTYHNTAMLLPDGRVLVGGHAPISTAYLSNIAIPGGNPNPDRDPTFEIYEPPYLFRGDRPTIESAPDHLGYGGTIEIDTPDPESIESVVLMRNTAITHLVDGDQRSVMLPIVSRTDHSVTVNAPPRAAVAPAGPYLLFLNKGDGGDLIPSVGKQVFVGTAPAPAPPVAPTPPPPPPPTLLPAIPTLPLPPVTLPQVPLPPVSVPPLGKILGGLFGK